MPFAEQNWTRVAPMLARQNWRYAFETETALVRHATFEFFGLPATATLAECKRAYYRRMLDCHPDRGGTNAEATAVNLAWERLRDSF